MYDKKIMSEYLKDDYFVDCLYPLDQKLYKQVICETIKYKLFELQYNFKKFIKKLLRLGR